MAGSQHRRRKYGRGWRFRPSMNEVLPCALARSLSCPQPPSSRSLLLAGCTPSTTDDSEPSPTASAAADLCGAKVASGAASDAVTAEGEVGAEPTATFTAPLEVTEPQSTVIEEGSGDEAESGDLIQIGLSAYRRHLRREGRGAGLQRRSAPAADLARQRRRPAARLPEARFALRRGGARGDRRQQPRPRVPHRRVRNGADRGVGRAAGAGRRDADGRAR